MKNNVEVIISDTKEKVATAMIKSFLSMIRAAGQNRFNIALSGGKTPGFFFESIETYCKDKVNWKRVHFWWSDERCVPPFSSESNYRMANETLFSKILIPARNIHRIIGEAEPQSEAQRYGIEIKQNLNMRNDWPVFDLILLGLGADGHTASIFPNRMQLLESDKICEVATHPATGQKRITLTGKAINNANEIFFLVTGSEKAKCVSEIMNNSQGVKKMPAYHIIPAHGKLTWFLDSAAAEKI